MSRELGRFSSVRLASTRKQFDALWPSFVAAVGALPFVGLNCKANSVAVFNQLADQGVDADRTPHKDELPILEPWSDLAGTSCSGSLDWHALDRAEAAALLRRRDANARRGSVALIQLASTSGFVLLVRTTFFDVLPPPLKAFLESSDVVKVGQGLEKDAKMLRSSFDTNLSAFVDLRNFCLLWPWFSRHHDFRSLGARSAAQFLLPSACGGDSATTAASPAYVLKILDAEQIRFCAEEVQLSLDVFLVVRLRQYGWRLAHDWPHNRDFGRILYLLSAAYFEQPFLDKKLRPSALKSASTAAARRRRLRKLLQKLQDQSTNGPWSLADLWAWPLPADFASLCRQLTRGVGEDLPCQGAPFAAVCDRQLVPRGHHSPPTVVHLRGVHRRVDGAQRVYKVRVTVRAVDESNYEGAEGSGDPLDEQTLTGDPDNPWECEQIRKLLPSVMAAAESSVEMIRMQQQWRELDRDLSSVPNLTTLGEAVADWSKEEAPTNGWQAEIPSDPASPKTSSASSYGANGSPESEKKLLNLSNGYHAAPVPQQQPAARFVMPKVSQTTVVAPPKSSARLPPLFNAGVPPPAIPEARVRPVLQQPTNQGVGHVPPRPLPIGRGLGLNAAFDRGRFL